ncbi:hypothetical protein [Pseudomonas sp. SJZ079]|uniref:hypothetical protein n=1 Tax=Pseudomonas sp. SJZ079 TaxID=2572887 RepID=UPI0011BF77DC|nr:hypothetical protein [Pseudomonas sp. SJZ079]
MECNTELLPIAGVVIGAAIPLLKDWLSGRRVEKIEKIKLHDIKKLEAYQRAYKFSSTLRLSLLDSTQSEDLAFLNGCAAELFSTIGYLPYYSPQVRSSLVELEQVIEAVMNNIMDEEYNIGLVEKRVGPLSIRLKSEIIKELNAWW